MMSMDTTLGPSTDGGRWRASLLTACCMTLALAVLWTMSHRYIGLDRDAELYALQASARLHPNLAGDVYLAYGSQDRFTVFSPLYAAFIGWLGLNAAELTLFVTCTVLFLAAAWALAKALWGDCTAWLATAMVAVIISYYGAYGIFHYAELYLSARSLGEALVVVALALHFHGRPRAALGLTIGALAIHPLMALPGLGVLILYRLGVRRAVGAVMLAAIVALALALISTHVRAQSGLLTVIDGDWLEMVRERSQFLFLGEWHASDWMMHARAFLCLTFSTVVLEDGRARLLCFCAMLVGALGLIIAWIAGAIGPMALLLQGQAWRWFWIAGFVCVLALAPTAMRLWRDDVGKLCAVLLVASWIFPPLPELAPLAALALWLVRGQLTTPTARLIRYSAYLVLVIVAIWSSANAVMVLNAPRTEISVDPLWVDRIRSVMGLQVIALAGFRALLAWIGSRPPLWQPTLGALAMLAFLPWAIRGSLFHMDQNGSRRQVEDFADWRAAIPLDSTVVFVPARKNASFVWFTLGRPSYISVDQSSGVVFSRDTAREIRRRSQVLLPVLDPDWQLRTQLEAEANHQDLSRRVRPLTAERLRAICVDPVLGFVIAAEKVGFEPLRHTRSGDWKNWNLYDCRKVRESGPAV